MDSLRVLIVEDEAPKRKHIESLVLSLSPQAQVAAALSVTSALNCLEGGYFDLVILDMSLPTFDVGERESGGRPQGFGGTEILRYMTMANIERPTVVITGYDGFTRDGGGIVDLAQLRVELQEEFRSCLVDVLHYNSTLDDWRSALSRSILIYSGGTNENTDR